MPNARVRFDDLKTSQRSVLLDSAQAEFTANGFEKASLNRILANASMSKGQAYYYIKGKSDLYAHMFERSFSPLLQSLALNKENVKNPGQFWAWVEHSFLSVAGFFNQHPDLAALGRTAYESTAALDALSTHPQRLKDAFDIIIRHGQSVGAIRQDLPFDMLSALLFAILKELDRWFALNGEKLDAADLQPLQAKCLELLQRLAAA